LRECEEKAAQVAAKLEDSRKEQAEDVVARRELIASTKTAKEVANGYRSN